MQRSIWRWAGIAVLIVAIAFVIAPLSAHQGERTQPPSQSEASPQMEMSWPTGDEPGVEHKRPTTLAGRTLAWLGAWHPAAVHFPIALTLTVAFLELVAVVRRRPAYAAGNNTLLAIAALGALVAAPLGWADAGPPASSDGDTLSVHRWLGTALPCLLLVLWFLKLSAAQPSPKSVSLIYASLLGLAVLAILVQAYLGAEVTHGAGHMAF